MSLSVLIPKADRDWYLYSYRYGWRARNYSRSYAKISL